MKKYMIPQTELVHCPSGPVMLDLVSGSPGETPSYGMPGHPGIGTGAPARSASDMRI